MINGMIGTLKKKVEISINETINGDEKIEYEKDF